MGKERSVSASPCFQVLLQVIAEKVKTPVLEWFDHFLKNSVFSLIKLTLFFSVWQDYSNLENWTCSILELDGILGIIHSHPSSG